MSRYLAVVNPMAGGGRCGKRAPGVISALREAGVEIDIVETGAAGDAIDIVRREWAQGRRSFIGVGGDGTNWEIMNGLFPEALASEERPRVGFLPLGTGNSFLRDFTDDGARYAIEYIRDGKSRPVDVIRATHTEGEMFYTNLLSIGFTADVGALVNNRLKRFGELGYGMGVLWTVLRLKARPMPWSIDGQAMNREPVVFLSFNNSKFTGGKMRMAPNADAADGLIEGIIVGDMNRVELSRTFPKIFEGTHVHHPKVQERQARTVDFDLDGPVDVMVDGEVVRLHLQRLDVLSHAVEVMA